MEERGYRLERMGREERQIDRQTFRMERERKRETERERQTDILNGLRKGD